MTIRSLSIPLFTFFVLASLVARADTLTITEGELPDGRSFLVFDSTFSNVTVVDATTEFVDFTITPPAGTTHGSFNSGISEFALIEADRSISDVLDLSFGSPCVLCVEGIFQSDPLTIVGTGYVTFQEGPDPINVATITFSNDAGALLQSIDIMIQSDLDVPEPSTLLLLASAIAALVAWHRRRAARA